MSSGTKHVYHGSKEVFEKFCFDFCGTNGGTSGAGLGIYFTESKAEALTYGEIIYECTINLKSSIHNETVTFTDTNIKQILSNLYKKYKKAENKKFTEYDELFINSKYYDNNLSYFDNINNFRFNLKNNYKSDTEILKTIANIGFSLDYLMEVLVFLGFTHTIDLLEPIDKISTHYIVYDLNNIQINKITKPLENKVFSFMSNIWLDSKIIELTLNSNQVSKPKEIKSNIKQNNDNRIFKKKPYWKNNDQE